MAPGQTGLDRIAQSVTVGLWILAGLGSDPAFPCVCVSVLGHLSFSEPQFPHWLNSDHGADLAEL